MKPSIHSKYSNENPPYLDNKWEYVPSYEPQDLFNKFCQIIKYKNSKN